MIETIELENFKAFRNQRIDLSPLTILAGANSSGKSTVLQALGLVRQSLVTSASKVTELSLNGEWVQLGTGRDVRHEHWIQNGSKAGDVRIAITEDGVGRSLSGGYLATSDVLPIRRPPSVASFKNSSLSGRLFQYIRADRMVPQTSYQRSYESVTKRNSLGAHGQFVVDFLLTNQDSFEIDPALAHPAEDRLSILTQVEAWLGSISPGTNVDLSSLEGTDSVRLSFRLGRSGLDSSNSYRPTNVGFGLSYALPVIVAALVSQRGGLLLIENPEAHLHPSGQAALGTLLVAASRAGTQVVVETHSDHVLNSIRLSVRKDRVAPDEVGIKFFSRPERGEPTIDSPTILPNGAIDRWPDGFFDEWDSAIVELTS